MTISFGGLATGLDTNGIIDAIMNVERQPLARLETDKTWLNNRLSAFTELDSKLNTFLDSIANLGDPDVLAKRSVSLSSSDYFSATVSSEALAGTSYQVEVLSIAQVQKTVSDAGFADKTSNTFGTGTLNLTVGTTTTGIEITAENNSLEGIMQAINDAGLGVTASIINDGTASPYRLMLTGEDVGTSFSLDTTGLTGGTDTLGTFTDTQTATQAHIQVDGIDIYSDNNTISEAIPGVTLDLTQTSTGTTTRVDVELNKTSIQSTIEEFAKGYNEVIQFITGQSTMGDTEAGVLAGDAGINSIKRHLQNMLTDPYSNSGVFSTLSELGFETQKDGTLVVNSEKLSDAIDTNLDSVTSLLAGDDGQSGLASEFQDYLESMTDSSNGMLAGRKEAINNNIEQIDAQIERTEARLAKREETLRAQYLAMEQLVSQWNSTGDYLMQQLDSISSLSKK
ncbi:flagellar hook-associated protein 2 [Desulfolithobacter dissulfuricans]|uniref:Flagellar hook-associated protein 2 n=1 Tax=Desulfolithobacter dissulfuricans TaxID=2795293 RepID=A0A915U132_9BACT|nr:flagellar filament capping protein FliD [Desulfolithobacter dissulfuricans]BCO08492.1 flagellar hook-associated protein 2 [Desulfolithobacter dissulfuricans]